MTVTRRRIGRLRLGATRRQALKALGQPRARSLRRYRWCVAGGGSLTSYFSRGRARRITLRLPDRPARSIARR
jgi:hypothetical protein